MATDSGIVTIYDMENDGKPLVCHRIDARAFLAHASGRWSAVHPEGRAVPAITAEDNGETMKLKEMSLKALQGMADKAGVEGWAGMKKAELVKAMLPGKE